MILLHLKRHPRHYPYPPMGAWFMRGVIKKLKLDESQQVKLLSLQNSLAASRSFLTNIENERYSMMDEVFASDRFNRDAALQLMKVPHLAFEEHAPTIVEALANFYDSLDDKQRQQVRSLWDKYHRTRRRCWH